MAVKIILWTALNRKRKKIIKIIFSLWKNYGKLNLFKFWQISVLRETI